MKNCISRRSFLKAAGILGAAGALGRLRRFLLHQHCCFLHRFLCCKCSQHRRKHQAVDIPHRRLGQ